MKTEEKKTMENEEQLIDLDQWRKEKIKEALRYQANRSGEHPVPKTYDESKNGRFYGCMATATDPYGDKSLCYANKEFINPKSKDYYEKKGFRKLADDEPDEFGDLHQLWVDDKTPTHMLTLTGRDNESKNLYTYGGGAEKGKINRGHFPLSESDKIVRYRFVGRPEQLEQIRQHNQNILDRKAKEAIERQKKIGVEVEPKESTTKFLQSIIQKGGY